MDSLKSLEDLLAKAAWNETFDPDLKISETIAQIRDWVVGECKGSTEVQRSLYTEAFDQLGASKNMDALHYRALTVHLLPGVVPRDFASERDFAAAHGSDAYEIVTRARTFLQHIGAAFCAMYPPHFRADRDQNPDLREAMKQRKKYERAQTALDGPAVSATSTPAPQAAAARQDDDASK